MNTFEELNLNQSLRKALNDLGYTVPTSIQSKAFSVVMSGSDVIGIAQTGTGKTLAYLLPCLRLWNFTKDIHPQILIIVPTRELVAQVEQEIQKLSTYMTIRICGVYGGTNIKNQAKIIQEGIDIIVGTPGRLLDLVLNGHLKLKSIKRLIIDEVDEMLDLGFRPQLIRVFDLLPNKRQNLMFSATLTYDVEQLILTYFSNTIKIEAAPSGTPLEKIILQGYKVPNFNTKINVLEYLLKKEEFKKTLIFTRTKALADQVFEKLNLLFPNQIGIIHSNKEQNYRFKSVEDFKQGITTALIATDIIARGIDIEGVSHVINFDIPDLPELYIHRIGRTGRADKDGIAISFITEKDEPLHDEIETFIQKAVSIIPLPEVINISDILTDDELPNTGTREIQIKRPKIDLTSSAFHEKSDKNKKTNHKIRRNEKMMKKYGKPITRGQKKKKSS